MGRETLVYALNFRPEKVGVARYTTEVVQHLADRGCSVAVITSSPHYPEWKVQEPYKPFSYYVEQDRGIRIFRCPVLLAHPMKGLKRLVVPLSFAIASLPILVWVMLRHRPRVLYCVEPTLLAAPLALLLARMIGCRAVLHVQDLEVEAAFAVGHLRSAMLKRLGLRLESWTMRQCDGVITIGERMRDKILAKGIPADRVALVRNWVDTEAIRPLTGPNPFRLRQGWAASQCVALYSGSFGPKQPLGVVLEAARLLRDRSDILFVLAGEGPTKSALVETYGGLPNVRFLPAQPEERLCHLLNAADLHLLPWSRGAADLVVPSKLGGMLASGKPVLATADPDTELHTILQGTAILCPSGNSEAMAREIGNFVDAGRSHPALGDGRALAMSFSSDIGLPRIAELLAPSALRARPPLSWRIVDLFRRRLSAPT